LQFKLIIDEIPLYFSSDDVIKTMSIHLPHRIIKKMKFNFLFLLALFFGFVSFAQPQLKDKNIKAKNIRSTGFDIFFETERKSDYQISFIPIKNAIDTLYFESNSSKRRSHEVNLRNLSPSSFYRAEFKLFDATKDTLYLTKTYATSSIQEGEIIAYFNHSINEEVASSDNNIAHFIEDATRDTLINYIGRAEESIDIAIYNSFGNNPASGIAGAINQAFVDGVQVRVIHDGSTSSSMISVLNSSIPVIQRQDDPNFPGIMHHKFMIVDAEHADATKSVVWTGATNWTTGQINGPDKNNVIILQDQTLAQTFKMEFDEMWGSTGPQPNFQNIKFGNTKEDNTPKEFSIGGIEVECYFSPTDGTQQQIQNLIEQAQESLVIATMLITRQNLAQAIIDQFTGGINELAFLIDTEDYTGQQKELLEANLGDNNYYEYTAEGIMHHKMMVVDHGTPNATVLTGSHNWSFSAENRNDENTLIIKDQALANQYYQAISQLYQDVDGTLTEANFKEPEFTFYPNPVNDQLYLNFSHAVDVVEVYDVLGKKVYSAQVPHSTTKKAIDFSSFKSGMYMIHLKSKASFTQFKVIKN